jgi:hypothetical protein
MSPAFFSKFFLFGRTVTVNAVFGALETGFQKGKTVWLLLMGLLASLPPMLMDQCSPSRGRGSSSASWMHLGRRGAVKLAARLKKTLTYYQTILGGNSICGATRANECPPSVVRRIKIKIPDQNQKSEGSGGNSDH